MINTECFNVKTYQHASCKDSLNVQIYYTKHKPSVVHDATEKEKCNLALTYVFTPMVNIHSGYTHIYTNIYHLSILSENLQTPVLITILVTRTFPVMFSLIMLATEQSVISKCFINGQHSMPKGINSVINIKCRLDFRAVLAMCLPLPPSQGESINTLCSSFH